MLSELEQLFLNLTKSFGD